MIEIKPDFQNYEECGLPCGLETSLAYLKELLGGTSDLLLNEVKVAGHDVCLACFEGMVSTATITELILHPLMYTDFGKCTAEELFSRMQSMTLMGIDRSTAGNYGELCRFLMSGFGVILIDGVCKALVFGVQGYAVKGIGEPSGEENIRGSHEGFTEQVRTNMSLIRRRIKSPTLRFELYPIGSRSKTDISIAYLVDRVPDGMIEELKRRIDEIELETVLTSGYLEPFLERHIASVFRSVGTTERPDAVCAKILEGRAAVIVDGTPFVIIVPYLLTENFQTVDDYCEKPFFASYLRWIRYAAFLLAILMPGMYVAAATFHPELFNAELLITLAAAERTAPLSLFTETLLMLVAYEIIKEAGLRLPKVIGGAVNIVGGLIIGDAAVSSGLISMPLLLTVALSITAAYAVPGLNPQITALRYLFLICGGAAGFVCIGAALSAVMINAAAVSDYGVPIGAPVSPLTAKAMGDTAVRIGFRRMQSRNAAIKKLNGVEPLEE